MIFTASSFLRLIHGLFLYEEVMSVRLYVYINSSANFATFFQATFFIQELSVTTTEPKKKNHKAITLIPSCDAKKKSISDNVVISVSTTAPDGTFGFFPMQSREFCTNNLVL